MEIIKCLVLEEISDDNTSYRATIRSKVGNGFQGCQFSDSAFRYLSQHRMFRRVTNEYREFYFLLDVKQERKKRSFFKSNEDAIEPLNIDELKKEVYALASYIEENMETLQIKDLSRCVQCQYEDFDKATVLLKVNHQPRTLKICKKCGTTQFI